MRRGRWRRAATPESYLQAAAALAFLGDLPESTRQGIALFATASDGVVFSFYQQSVRCRVEVAPLASQVAAVVRR
eukprot:5926310-Lingulodinium_polyedra.AAC.1